MIKAISPEDQGISSPEDNLKAEVAIERKAFTCRELRTGLDKLLTSLKKDLEEVKTKHLPELRTASRQLAGQLSMLMILVEENPALFKKPKSKVIHDIKLGFKAGAGQLQFTDEAEVIALIRKKLRSKKSTLIKTVHSVVKAAVKNLPSDELALINCSIVGKEDSVEIGFIDGDIEKAINNLIGAMVDAMTEEKK